MVVPQEWSWRDRISHAPALKSDTKLYKDTLQRRYYCFPVISGVHVVLQGTLPSNTSLRETYPNCSGWDKKESKLEVEQNQGFQSDWQQHVNSFPRRHLLPALFCLKIWNSDIKFCFHSNLLSVVLYGSSSWKVTSTITRKLQIFINSCSCLVIVVL